MVSPRVTWACLTAQFGSTQHMRGASAALVVPPCKPQALLHPSSPLHPSCPFTPFMPSQHTFHPTRDSIIHALHQEASNTFRGPPVGHQGGIRDASGMAQMCPIVLNLTQAGCGAGTPAGMVQGALQARMLAGMSWS